MSLFTTGRWPSGAMTRHCPWKRIDFLEPNPRWQAREHFELAIENNTDYLANADMAEFWNGAGGA
ncbi:MAG: hypothetical protein ACTSUY_02810, partial [Alphaproteobacteria bacterium]